MAIINEVEGCRDLGPAAESVVHHGKATSREEERERPDHGQKCTVCAPNFREVFMSTQEDADISICSSLKSPFSSFR